MTDQMNTSELAASASHGAYEVRPAAEAPPVSPIAVAARLLRGRYRWALGLGSVFAVAGALAGAKSTYPTYRSTGLIEVAPKVNRVIWDIDEKGLLPMFDAYVETQTVLASSRRVIDLAIRTPEWRNLGRGISDEATAKFAQQLAVDHRSNSQCFSVSFSDPSADAAVVGVNQVMKAYMTLVDERNALGGQATRQQVERERAVTDNKLKEIRATIQQVTNGLGADGLVAAHGASIGEGVRLNAEVRELDLAIATTRAASEAASTDVGRVLTDDEILARAPASMQPLVAQRALAEAEVARLDSEQYGPNHELVVAARRTLAIANRRIAEYADRFRALQAATPDARDAELREMLAKRTNVVTLRDSVADEVKSLSRQVLTVDNLKAEQAGLCERLAEIKTRLDQLHVESSSQNRISVATWGDRPYAPEKDKRFSLAVAGGFGGIVLGFGLVLLWGLRDGQLRHISDVDGERSRGRFLGVVPDIQGGAAATHDVSPEMGDYCVHHIRTMLQLRYPDHRCMVTLTSPSPGAGKTTLALALGTSFAATGARTLLIDFDFVGHGMTTTARSLVCEGAARMLAKPAPADAANSNWSSSLMAGLLAARRISFDDRQVEELVGAAEDLAAKGDADAARTVRALGALSRPARDGQLAAGVPKRGVLGALQGRPLEDCIIETGTPHLALLPVGDAGAEDARCLSRAGVERLFAACHERYDIVLVDTGPVLGSIEAAFATATSNEVLVIVSRGDRRPLVDEALARIERIGARVAGVVFNRASTADVARSSYASRSKSVVTEVA